jgi:hypothetical protein
VRRIGRYILNTLTVLSLVLCVGTLGLWVRSHCVSDWITHDRESATGAVVTARKTEIGIGAGHAAVTVRTENWFDDGGNWRDSTKAIDDWSWDRAEVQDPLPAETPPTIWTRMGFAFTRDSSGDWFQGYRQTRVAAPLWLASLIAAALPAIRLTRAFRVGRRTAAGRCVRCGYDLRATPDRCPECGTVPKRSPVASTSRT